MIDSVGRFDDINITDNSSHIILNGSTINDSSPYEQDGISNLVLGIPITIMNGCLLYILYSLRRKINWKRFICILNLAISDLLCGVILILRGISRLNNAVGVMDDILNLELCTNILLTIVNYTCCLFIFYLAIKHPLYYKTKLTIFKILILIGTGWSAVLVYTMIKAWMMFDPWFEHDERTFDISFKSVDVTAMGLSLIFNTTFYVYVLKVATVKRCESLRRRRLSEKLPSVSSIESNGSNSSETSLISQGLSSTFVLYNTVIGLGIHLLTYITTVSPLMIFWIFSLALNNNLSENLKVVDVSLQAFWFGRAVIDPVIFLLRERGLFLSAFRPVWARFR